MNLAKPTHIAFLASAAIALLVAIFFEKYALMYVQPLSVITITLIYLKEKTEPVSWLYLSSQFLFIVGAMLLILGLREHLKVASVVFSIYYIVYLRLMYVQNIEKDNSIKAYVYVFLLSLPILYLYYIVIRTISSELKTATIYFSFLMFFMLSYILTALFYYIKKKSPSNLWMFLAAMNLGFMNIMIGINELYVYDTTFTVIIVFCSLCVQYFVMQFMLSKKKDDTELLSIL